MRPEADFMRVAEQLEHANASTTPRYYARWLPSTTGRTCSIGTTSMREAMTTAAGGVAGEDLYTWD